MSKHSTDFKKQVVDQYLAGKDGTDSIGRQNGIPVSMVRTWVAFYSAHGLDGLTKKFSHYSANFKLSVLQRLWENTGSARQVAAAFNIRSAAVIGL